MSYTMEAAKMVVDLIETRTVVFGERKTPRGRVSPVRVNTSNLLTSPTAFKRVVLLLLGRAGALARYGDINSIAPGSYDAIPLASMLAYQLNMPFIQPVFTGRSKEPFRTFGAEIVQPITGKKVLIVDTVLFHKEPVVNKEGKIWTHPWQATIESLQNAGADVPHILFFLNMGDGGNRLSWNGRDYGLHCTFLFYGLLSSFRGRKLITEEQFEEACEYLSCLSSGYDANKHP